MNSVQKKVISSSRIHLTISYVLLGLALKLSVESSVIAGSILAIIALAYTGKYTALIARICLDAFTEESKAKEQITKIIVPSIVAGLGIYLAAILLIYAITDSL